MALTLASAIGPRLDILNNNPTLINPKYMTQSALTIDNGFLSRSERVAAFGVDCNDDITWRLWNVGGEYERRFLIKNTHDKRQIITYKLPKQKATFFVEFPEPATISSGMSYTLVIKFRPLEMVEHHDELEITVKGRGSFKVRLDAYTPYAHLTTPSKFDFNMCPVNVSSQHAFHIKNTGTIPLQFFWEVPKPFSLMPSEGSLLEGQSMDMTVLFTPTAACACVGQAICRLTETNDIIAVITFSGIGKFAFIHVKDCPDGIVDFGDVLTSTSETKYLSLVNPSFVDTDFDLRLSNPDITSAFAITPLTGTVPRGGETRLAIKFNPKNSGAHYTSDFNVNSASCATIAKFRCSGCAVGPRVHLSASNVDFGDIDIESFYRDPTNPSTVLNNLNNRVTGPKTIDKWVTVNNDSDLPIRFHVTGCDPGCAFVVTPTSGSLKPKSSTNVKITFAPTSPINHLRRLFVMTTAGESALILDVFGTAYTPKIRPAPFNNKAVQLFFSKLEYGLGGMTPEEGERLIALMNTQQQGLVGGNQHGNNISSTTDAPNDNELAAQDAFRAALDEIQFPKRRRAGFATVFPKSVGQHTFPFLIDRDQLTVRHETVGQAQSVVIRNTTSSKASAYWSTPTGPEAKFWSVEPIAQDVPANGTATFRITCAPNAPPQTFGNYLECYVNYKTMRSFRLVNEDVFTPPHCLLIQCTHLAPYRENGPVPAVRFVNSVSFQPCRDERSVYQVLELTNDGDTAVAYDMQVETSMVPDAGNKEFFSSSSMAGVGDVDENGYPIPTDPEDDVVSNKRKALLTDVFQCYPSVGTLPAKSSYMVLLKFSPPRASKFYGALHISYNGAPTVSGNVLLKGEGFVPQVELDCGGVLTFRPTTVGGNCTRQYTVTNLSRIPLAFQATIPEEFSNIVELSPPGAILRGSEKFKITATFTPQSAHRYEFQFPFVISVPSELDAPLSTTVTSPKNAIGVGGVAPKAFATPSLSNIQAPSADTAKSAFFTPAPEIPFFSSTQLCTMKAEGHAAFLSLDPLSFDLGDIGVGSANSFPLTIYNTGLSDVCFELRYALKSCEAAPCDDVTNKNNINNDEPLEEALEVSQNTTNTEVIDNGSLLSFGPAAVGTVRARAHHTVSVSTKLTQRGKHSFVIYIVSGGDLSLVSSTARLANLEELRLPQCLLKASGQSACLQVADARCVYQQKSQLWRQMNIGKINERLAEKVCKQDIQMRALSFDDSLAALKPLKCNLGVDVFHATPVRVHIALANNSSSDVNFRFRFPIDNEIPKEPWHADQRGLDDPVANVVDRGLFDISPRSGTVGAYDQTTITFTYFHSEVGEHQLPVILRVEDGKEVLLQLSATTIESNTKYLMFHHEMEHELVPIAIGDLEPPQQYTEVQNLSSSAVNYSIDESSLNALREANYDFPILQCLNPRGTIPPMSSLLLSWFFRPLEVKSYSATVKVVVEGGEVYTVTLSGQGYHPKQMSRAQIRSIYGRMFPMPRVPTLEHPSIPVRLSTDVLAFGSVPFHSYHRRHVSLTNNHPDDTFIYEWRSVLQHGDQIFEIEPPRGSVEPGVTVHFCVTMYSGSFSHIVDTAVHCHVMNESLRLRRAERMAVIEEQRRLAMDQKPDSADLSSTLRTNRSAADMLTGRGLRPRHRHAITTVPPKYQSTTRLQKTIQKLEETALAEDIDENAEEWAHVEVTPTIIELLIQTRIMPLTSFTDAYGEDAAHALFFPTMLGSMHPMRPGYFSSAVDRTSALLPRPESVISDTSLSQVVLRRSEHSNNNGTTLPLLTDVTPFERDMATSCLKEIIRRVVQAQDITDTLNDPSEDPVPYFCEMISTNAAGEGKPKTSSVIAEFIINEEDIEDEDFVEENAANNGLGLGTRDAYGDDEESNEAEGLARAAQDRHPSFAAGEIPQRRASRATSFLPPNRSTVSSHSHINDNNNNNDITDSRAQCSSTVLPRVKKSTQPVPGDVQCVAEEVIGDVIFFLMSQALAREGVVTQACDVARKQRRASEARLRM